MGGTKFHNRVAADDDPTLMAPQWRGLGVHGRRLWFEAGTLRLVETENGEGPPEIGKVHDPTPPRMAEPHKTPLMLVLIPTFDCNLRCRYCFSAAEAGEAGAVKSPEMPFDMAARALDQLEGGLSISFFGGEPLLRFDLIREVTAYVRGRIRERSRLKMPLNLKRAMLRPSLHVTTNGTLVDEGIAKWLGGHAFTAIVSIDGTPEQHDEFRVGEDGSGSYEAAERGARLMTASSVRHVMLRGTFGPENVSLVERVRHLNNLLRTGVGHGVSVEPSALAEYECSRGARGFRPGDIRALADEYHDLAEWMLSEWGAGRVPRHMQLERMARRILDRSGSCSQCGAGNGYLTLGPDGTWYACHRAGESTRIGDLRSGMDDKRRSAWIDNRLSNSVKCSDCWMRVVCGGACRQDALEQVGEMWTPSSVHCAIRFLWVREALWIIAEADARGILDRVRETADKIVGKGRGCCK